MAGTHSSYRRNDYWMEPCGFFYKPEKEKEGRIMKSPDWYKKERECNMKTDCVHLYSCRKPIQLCKSKCDEYINGENRHYHKAKYEDGKLLRECGLCGKDLTDKVHKLYL